MKVRNILSERKLNRMMLNQLPSFIFEILLYAACFFPFVEVVFYTGSDTQPYAALISMLILVIYWIQRTTATREYTIIAMIAVIVGGFAFYGLFTIMVYMVFRSYYTYFSLFTIPLAAFYMMKRNGGLNEILAKLCIWIWFLVGFIQKYINPQFGYSLLSRHSTNETRGVVGLGSEPSAYGFMCLFMMLLALGFKKYSKMYILLCMVQILLFASSSVTLVYLAVYLGAYIFNELVRHKKFAFLKALVVLGGGFGGLLAIAEFSAANSRMGIMVRTMFKDPKLIIEDGSIQMRFEAILFCFRSFLENHMLPHGLSEIKYMSGMGLLFYECGFIAIILVLAMAIIIWKAYPSKTQFTFVLGFLIMMCSSISFSTPMVCFYLGYCVYKGWERDNEYKKCIEELDKDDAPAIWYAGRLYRRRHIENETEAEM